MSQRLAVQRSVAARGKPQPFVSARTPLRAFQGRRSALNRHVGRRGEISTGILPSYSSRAIQRICGAWRDAMPSTLVATTRTVCVLFTTGIGRIEIGLQTEKRRRHLALKVGDALLRNPLVIAPALGALFPLSGLLC
jgi:hypothetical protein